jgi:uncharacterized protein YqeY
MSVQSELRRELEEAMRARDKARSNVIRQVETEVSMAKAAPGFDGEIDDRLYLETIVAYVKKMDKARREFEAAGERGQERADQLAYEIQYLAQWIPKGGPTEDETRVLVRYAIAELKADDPKMMGRVIGHVMKSTGGLDGAMVNRLVREELGA